MKVEYVPQEVLLLDKVRLNGSKVSSPSIRSLTFGEHHNKVLKGLTFLVLISQFPTEQQRLLSTPMMGLMRSPSPDLDWSMIWQGLSQMGLQ